MRPTRATRWLLAVAGGLVAAGAVTLTIAPSVIGAALAIYLVHTRLSTQRALDAAHPRLERRVLEGLVHEGDRVAVQLDATASTLPRGLSLRVEDQPPEGLDPLQDPTVLGPSKRTYPARATRRGTHRFTTARVRLTEARGLWKATRTIPVATQISVLPPREAIEEGKRLARRDPPEATTADPLGHIIRELEFESLRAHQPGDRLRDIDWKRVAKLGELITKEFESEREAPIVALIDASRTMRAQHGDATAKLDHAARLALELVEAAAEHGHPAGYVAFDELKVLDQVPPTHDRSLPQRLARNLAALPERLRTRRRLDVGLPEDHPADEHELDLLETLATLSEDARGQAATPTTAGPPGAHGPDAGGEEQAPSGQAARRRGTTGGGTQAMGLKRAIASLARNDAGEAVVLVLFSDLEHLPSEAIRVVGSAVAKGHQAITVVLPGSRFLDPPEDPKARDLENAYREVQTRQRARALLEARDVRVLELGPEETAASITAASGDPGPRARPSGPAHTGGVDADRDREGHSEPQTGSRPNGLHHAGAEEDAPAGGGDDDARRPADDASPGQADEDPRVPEDDRGSSA